VSINTTLVKKTRLDLLETFPKNAVIAELGTFAGDFAKQILYTCKPSRLHIVDLFYGQIQSGDENGNNVRRLDMGDIFFKLQGELKGNPVSLYRSDSIDWLSSQKPESLDAVYIDTSHTYKQTAGELSSAMLCVKSGGIIAGHDYDSAFEVIPAVKEFCERYSLDLEIWDGDEIPSFSIRADWRSLGCGAQ
jgi:hypothetical protein